MEIKSNLCSNAVRKVALLITAASSLGMDVSGYGQADGLYDWVSLCESHEVTE